jgi:hypothetical protein
VSVKLDPPAVVEAGLIEVNVGDGLLTVKLKDPEVPPPGAGFVTVIGMVPPEAILAAEIVAVRTVGETKTVVVATPFQFMVAPLTKFVPLTVSVKEPPPTVTEVGLREVSEGAGLLDTTTEVSLPIV